MWLWKGIRTSLVYLIRKARSIHYSLAFDRAARKLKLHYKERLILCKEVEALDTPESIWSSLKSILPSSVSLITVSLLDKEVSDIRDYWDKFREYYTQIGNAREKAIEHALTFELIDFDLVNRYCDIASAQSPISIALAHDYPNVEFWKQDLKFHTNLATRTLGGFAQNMKEISTGFFDVMTLHCSFEHFEGTSDSEFLQEVDRVLSSKGVCLILPLYLDRQHKIFFDPTLVSPIRIKSWDSEGKLCATYEFRQEHGRYYQPETLYSRLFNKCPSSLKTTVIRFCDQKKLSPEIYLKFGLVLHRENSVFKFRDLGEI